MTSARTALFVRTLVVGAVVLGTAGFVIADKVVTVSIDGEVHSVSTFAATVDEVLAEADVTVGEHDTVIPAAGAAITDGSRIEIRRGRLVVLNVDGVAHQVWTTAATLDELAGSLGSRYSSASLTASRSQRIPLTGLSVDLRMPKSVTLVHDGTSTEVVTTEPTVGAVLLAAGVDVAEADLLSTELTLAPVDGLTVTVVRVTTHRATDRGKIRYRTTKKADHSLYAGTTKVVKQGRPGIRRTTYVLTLHDGTVVSKQKISVHTVRRPVTRVLAYGTKDRPVVPTKRRTASGIDALNWGALAYCESSGNPRAVGGGGIYFGLYQFNLTTWHGVGGRGNPIDNSPAEQTYRAKLLYKDRGSQPWPVCGRMLYT